MGVIEEIKEMGRQFSEELPPEENDRMASKCLAGVWGLGALAMGVEAGVEWASQGTPINTQTIGSTVLALVAAKASKFFWRRGHAPQETANPGE